MTMDAKDVLFASDKSVNSVFQGMPQIAINKMVVQHHR